MSDSDRPKTILANVEGFTPAIDELVRIYGGTGALVFGRIWRYCQMEDQVCRVPLSRIAEELNMEKSTAWRYVIRLVEDGYLRDLTPDAGNRPHTYEDTGKASIDVSVRSQVRQTKSVAQKNALDESRGNGSSRISFVEEGDEEQNFNPYSGDVPQENVALKNAAVTEKNENVALKNEIVAQENVAQKNVFSGNEIVALKNESVALKNAHIRKEESIKKQEETHTQAAAVPTPGRVVCVLSKFSLEECRRYAEHLHTSRQGIINPGGYGLTIYRTGEMDVVIEEWLSSESEKPIEARPDPECDYCEGTGTMRVREDGTAVKFNSSEDTRNVRTCQCRTPATGNGKADPKASDHNNPAMSEREKIKNRRRKHDVDRTSKGHSA